MSRTRGTAVVTGASSGIGEAAARQLAAAGFEVVLGARRVERLERIAADLGAQARHLDVRDTASVAAFAETIPQVSLLVNNAGGAFGLEELEAADEENWRAMWETNVLGLMLVTRALLPKLEASGAGHIINIGSIAGFEVYRGGSGYTSVKHAVRAITRTLRLELLGKPVRVTEIDPGAVETEFSICAWAAKRLRKRSTRASSHWWQPMSPMLSPGRRRDRLTSTSTRWSFVRCRRRRRPPFIGSPPNSRAPLCWHTEGRS